MLSLRGVTKSYNQHIVLDNISFDLEKGKVLGIMGPNGAGKTTLLKIISLILKPASGTVHLNGIDALSNPKPLRPLLGYVPQDLALYDDLTVIDNLNYWSSKTIKDQESHFDTLLHETGLNAQRNKRVSTLSGGMKRRLNLAIALINEPELLIMDEPLVGTDIAQIHSLQNFLKTLANKGVTQILSSHNAYHLLNFADEIILLNEGKMRFMGSKAAFLDLCNNDLSKVDETILNMISYQEEHQ